MGDSSLAGLVQPRLAEALGSSGDRTHIAERVAHHQYGDPATNSDELILLQQALGELTPERWQPPATLVRIGGCFVCFKRSRGSVPPVTQGSPGPPSPTDVACWPGRPAADRLAGRTCPPCSPSEGPSSSSRTRPADRSRGPGGQRHGRDHPRRAGLAVHLGAVLGVPTVGVTTRPLLAEEAGLPMNAVPRPCCGWMGRWSAPGSGPDRVPSRWPCTPPGGPRLDAVRVVLAASRRARTPEPLRRARIGPNRAGAHALGDLTVQGSALGNLIGTRLGGFVGRCSDERVRRRWEPRARRPITSPSPPCADPPAACRRRGGGVARRSHHRAVLGAAAGL